MRRKSSPPSYDEAVRKLNNLIGLNPTPQKVFDAAKGLSNGDLETLTKNHDSHFPIKTDKEKEAFAVNAAKTASSPEAKGYINSASTAASRSAKEISAIFQRLQLKITEIDKIHHSDFDKPLQELQTEYQTSLGDSRLLAIEISKYGTSFDTVIIKFCADVNIAITKRQERIQAYINKAHQFETKAKEVDNRFESLVQSFSNFVSSFGKLDEELQDLKKKLSNLKAAQASVAAIGAAALPVTGLIGAASPPLSTFVLVGGIIAAGISIATVVGLIIAANRVENEIEAKTSEKQKLEKQIEQIRQARQELELLGSNSLGSFRANVQVLSGYWKTTIRDAKDIQGWLEKGAKDADKPQYMKLNLENAVHGYEVMAEYMRDYARGVKPN